MNGPTKRSRNFLSRAAAGSSSTTEPYRQLHIQHHGIERQRTSSDTLTLATNEATPTHKVLTNFVLDPTQPIWGVDHPSGPQACAKLSQTLHAPVTT